MSEHDPYEHIGPQGDDRATAERPDDSEAESFDAEGSLDTEAADGESYLDEDDGRLWEGDRGTLDAKQRDTLVALLKKAFISSDDRTEWRTLIQAPGPIAANLNNLYFNLVIDERSEVAYASPARTADTPFKSLVRDTPNNREETLLLIYLRERFRAATAAGEPHAFADTIAMFESVQRYRPDSATDHVADEKRVARAIDGLLGAGLLVKTKDEGRYRVHRAIEALLPLTKLNQLLDAFRRLNTGESSNTDEPDVSGGIDGIEAIGYSGRHAAPDTSNLAFAEAEQAAAERLGKAAGGVEEQGDSGNRYEETA